MECPVCHQFYEELILTPEGSLCWGCCPPEYRPKPLEETLPAE